MTIYFLAALSLNFCCLTGGNDCKIINCMEFHSVINVGGKDV